MQAPRFEIPGAGPGRVRKRDGREVPFDGAKIQSAIARAMAAAGEADETFAEEIAGVVELTLFQRLAGRREESAELGAGPPTPTIEEIQDLVEQALIELGQARVAKAYILYRDRRARIREALEVEPSEVRGPGSVSVQENRGTHPWSKGRIVAALIEEAGLPRATAEEAAARVERRVFDSGLARVTTALIRELLAGELMAMGLTTALRRSESVGLPRHDLRRALEGQALEPWEERPAEDVEAVVAGEVLRRWSLEDVLGSDLADMHLSGDLSVEDLRRPHLVLWTAVPTELLLSGEPSPAAAFELLEAAARLAAGTSRGVILAEPGAALAPLARATRASSSVGLSAWLRALAATSRAAGRRIDLGSPGPRFGAFTQRLAADLAALPEHIDAPRLYLDEGELEALLATSDREGEGTVERLLASGRLVSTWGRPDERFVGPGCRRRAREHNAVSSGGAVCIHLPRLARRAGAWREDLVLEQLSGLVQCALEICRRLSVFQRRCTAVRGTAGELVRARTSFSLVPVGLAEALRLLGGGEADPSQGARLLGFAAEAARRFSASMTEAAVPEMVLDPFGGERAARRFAWLDAAEQAQSDRRQPLLFGGSAQVRAERPYSRGFALPPSPLSVGGDAEGELTRTVTAGALWPPPAGEAAGRPRLGGEALPRVAAWRRFVERRSGVWQGGEGLFFPAESDPRGELPRRLAHDLQPGSFDRDPGTDLLRSAPHGDAQNDA